MINFIFIVQNACERLEYKILERQVEGGMLLVVT